jgi:hypothetical protein
MTSIQAFLIRHQDDVTAESTIIFGSSMVQIADSGYSMFSSTTPAVAM